MRAQAWIRPWRPPERLKQTWRAIISPIGPTRMRLRLASGFRSLPWLSGKAARPGERWVGW